MITPANPPSEAILLAEKLHGAMARPTEGNQGADTVASGSSLGLVGAEVREAHFGTIPLFDEAHRRRGPVRGLRYWGINE